MSLGLSLYFGLNQNREKSRFILKLASEMGYKKLFTSFHIPEADYENIVGESQAVIKEACNLGYEVIADISPNTFTFFSIPEGDLKSLKNTGISTIRIDWGYTAQAIAAFSNNKDGLQIEINASTATKSFMGELEKHKAHFKNIQSSHNYYVRPETGISVALCKQKNDLLHYYDVAVSGFVSATTNKRPPLFLGLPTLEMCRNVQPRHAAKLLFEIGCDSVCFGDAVDSPSEIESLSDLDSTKTVLDASFFCSKQLKTSVCNSPFSDRTDYSEYFIRTNAFKNQVGTVLPENCDVRKIGHICLDNAVYKRYMGELTIIKKDLNKDEKVNIIGKVVSEDVFLLDHIAPEKHIIFKEV